MISLRGWHRRLALGLPTVLGLKRRGFFIPYHRAGELFEPGIREPYQALEARFADCQEAFTEWLSVLAEYADKLLRIGDAAPPAPRWSQDWFPRLDAAMAYTMVRRLRPKRIVEVGSGHSTRFFARAIADSGLNTSVTAIDPAPRADLAGLKAVQLLRRPLQEVGFSPFADLAAGDILAIDSSHVLMPGSDVDMLQNRILPQLAAGVVVQLHDIFLPDDYPAEWEWRGYNEQLGVAALLQGGSGWIVEFASHYAVTRLANLVEAGTVGQLPRPMGAHESGLWIRKA